MLNYVDEHPAIPALIWGMLKPKTQEKHGKNTACGSIVILRLHFWAPYFDHPLFTSKTPRFKVEAENLVSKNGSRYSRRQNCISLKFGIKCYFFD